MFRHWQASAPKVPPGLACETVSGVEKRKHKAPPPHTKGNPTKSLSPSAAGSNRTEKMVREKGNLLETARPQNKTIRHLCVCLSMPRCHSIRIRTVQSFLFSAPAHRESNGKQSPRHTRDGQKQKWLKLRWYSASLNTIQVLCSHSLWTGLTLEASGKEVL